MENELTMNSVAELQLRLHQAIDTVNDEKKLSAIYELLKDSKGPFSPLRLEDYVSAIDEARKQVKDGKITTVDDLEKESENW